MLAGGLFENSPRWGRGDCGLHPSTKSADIYAAMRNLTDDDLTAIAGHILQPKIVGDKWEAAKSILRSVQKVRGEKREGEKSRSFSSSLSPTSHDTKAHYKRLHLKCYVDYSTSAVIYGFAVLLE